MGKVTGFLEFARVEETAESKGTRVKHYREFVGHLSDAQAQVQGARCMDCGIPFCMNGCPVNNIIPDFNDLVYREDWKSAIDTLHSTNNFPEFTGRICPAPCEEACTLRINEAAVGIKSIEHAIIDKAWQEGWVQPTPAAVSTGKRVAVVGSGPAGLAAAQQLARAGHAVVVFEKNDRVGGLLRYGIPDFRMEKGLIDRRVDQMRAEGVEFRTGVQVGDGKALPPGVGSLARSHISAAELDAEFDAVILADIAARALTESKDPAIRRQAVSDYLRTRLFEPVGMHSAVPEFDAAGTFIGGSIDQEFDLIIALQQQGTDVWRERNVAIAHFVEQRLHMVRELNHTVQTKNAG